MSRPDRRNTPTRSWPAAPERGEMLRTQPPAPPGESWPVAAKRTKPNGPDGGNPANPIKSDGKEGQGFGLKSRVIQDSFGEAGPGRGRVTLGSAVNPENHNQPQSGDPLARQGLIAA